MEKTCAPFSPRRPFASCPEQVPPAGHTDVRGAGHERPHPGEEVEDSLPSERAEPPDSPTVFTAEQ